MESTQFRDFFDPLFFWAARRKDPSVVVTASRKDWDPHLLFANSRLLVYLADFSVR